jgi:hypothetical protein
MHGICNSQRPTAARIRKMAKKKKFNALIRTRTREPPVCTIVPQPATEFTQPKTKMCRE